MYTSKKTNWTIAVIGALVVGCMMMLGETQNSVKASQENKTLNLNQKIETMGTINSGVPAAQLVIKQHGLSSTRVVLPQGNSQQLAEDNRGSEIANPAIFENSDYANYEKSTLVHMADSGDVIAMQVLAVRYMTKERSEANLESAQQLLEKAIAYGSKSYPFQFLAEQRSLKLRSSMVNIEHISEEEKRAALVDTFMYYEVAAMRGNSQLKSSMTELYKEHYKLAPTTAEWALIQDQASVLYNKYEQNRLAAGLGNF